MVWEHLAKLGSAAFPALRDACEARDPRLRLRARNALQQLSFDEVDRELQEISSRTAGEFDLLRAFAVLGRIVDPDIREADLSRTLDELAAQARPRLRGLHTPPLIIRTLNQVFHEEMKFTIDRGAVDDARLLTLSHVLRHRAGLPLAVAVVYLLLGQRLKLPLRAIGLPDNVLVRYSGERDEFYVDPGVRGKLYTRRECFQEFLRDYYPRDSYFQELGGRELTVRALRGMLLVYSKQQSRPHVRRLTRFLEILQVRERLR